MRGVRGRLAAPRCGGAIVGIVLGVLTFGRALTGLAWGQVRDPLKPGPLEYISHGDRRVIRAQVELGIRFAEMAREILLRHGAEPEELKRAEALGRKSYVFLRYAMHGVDFLVNHGELLMYEKSLARMALAEINQAPEQYVAEAVREFGEAIPVARRASFLLR